MLRVQVQERLNRLVHKHQGGIILIEGDPGMGKTRLLEELEHTSMGQHSSTDKDKAQDLAQGLTASRLKKLCNVFVANGDLASKSKVTDLAVCAACACTCKLFMLLLLLQPSLWLLHLSRPFCFYRNTLWFKHCWSPEPLCMCSANLGVLQQALFL